MGSARKRAKVDAGPVPSTVVVNAVETPAFVVDERVVLRQLDAAAQIRARTGCRLLYTLKPLSYAFLLELMRPHVDGFAVSSAFEARLARETIGGAGTVHLTAPGLRASELNLLDSLCDTVAFNSLSQLARLASGFSGGRKTALRINPRLSVVDDARYDPCRPNSKLGVPIGQLRRMLNEEPAALAAVHGLHFHTNCDATSFRPLRSTVDRIEEQLGDWLGALDWINLGGGYLLSRTKHDTPLIEAVEGLRARYGLEVFIEPGAALVREAGSLVTEVVDLFRSGGKTIAVLDTTINHWPEIFEYQFEPDVLGHQENAAHEYLLAGCSCLAGDILGEYAFDRPLAVGSRLVLPEFGAYSQVKAHMFNGINLPTVYSINLDGDLVLRRRYTYDDFSSRCGDPSNATV